MKISIKPKMLALVLASGLSLTGCGQEVSKAEIVRLEPIEQENAVHFETIESPKATEQLNFETIDAEEVKVVFEAHSNEEANGSKTEELEQKTLENNPLESIVYVDVVMGNAQVNVRSLPSEDSERINVLPKNDVLEYVGEEGNWYKVICQGKEGYVSKDYCSRTQVKRFTTPIQKVVMLTEEKVIDTLDEHIIIPKYECAEVYYEDEDRYLVQTNDHIGYITKENTCDMKGTYAIVDITDQELRVYEDNKCIYLSPVVTGKNNATHIGEFEIYDISSYRYLVGPGYKSYVDYMLKFDGNIGLHDAEYHTNKNGKSHGWRDFSEFGGETYITNGSHGCVNLPHDTAEFVYENMTYNDKVIVKK